MVEKYHCRNSQKEDDQVEGTNKRYLHPERIGQVVWRMPLHSARDGTERTGEKRQSWEDIHIFGFEERRSATEISMAIRVLAAAARDWRPEL